MIIVKLFKAALILSLLCMAIFIRLVGEFLDITMWLVIPAAFGYALVWGCVYSLLFDHIRTKLIDED